MLGLVTPLPKSQPRAGVRLSQKALTSISQERQPVVPKGGPPAGLTSPRVFPRSNAVCCWAAKCRCGRTLTATSTSARARVNPWGRGCSLPSRTPHFASRLVVPLRTTKMVPQPPSITKGFSLLRIQREFQSTHSDNSESRMRSSYARIYVVRSRYDMAAWVRCRGGVLELRQRHRPFVATVCSRHLQAQRRTASAQSEHMPEQLQLRSDQRMWRAVPPAATAASPATDWNTRRHG